MGFHPRGTGLGAPDSPDGGTESETVYDDAEEEDEAPEGLWSSPEAEKNLLFASVLFAVVVVLTGHAWAAAIPLAAYVLKRG